MDLPLLEPFEGTFLCLKHVLTHKRTLTVTETCQTVFL